MGLKEDDIVCVSAGDLQEYDGEPMVLPFNFLSQLLPDVSKISAKVTPVFLGISLAGLKILDRLSVEQLKISGQVDYLARYAPIGTRDEYSRKVLTSLGIPAYLQGCLTNIFPRRKSGDYRKTYLINCPVEVLPHIPSELLTDAEALNNSENVTGLTPQQIYRKIKTRCDEIRDTAKLIITSRYHIATPCYAMGIPTIFVRKPLNINIGDVRLDTLNPLIPMYSYRNFDEMDWTADAVDFPEIKRVITDCAIARIRDATARITMETEIQSFYKRRIDDYESVAQSEKGYFRTLENYIIDNFPAPASNGYFIYGAKVTNTSYDGTFPIIERIRETNPDLACKGFIDNFHTGYLAGRPIYKPDEVAFESGDFVIIVAETAVEDALSLLERCGVAKSLVLTTRLVTNRMITGRSAQK
jgi:hypothetical protein